MPCVIKPPTNTFSEAFVPGSFDRTFTTVMDFLPTFLDLAGISLPIPELKEQLDPLGTKKVTRSMTRFRGKDVHAIRGLSMVPYFAQGKTKEDGDQMWAVHASSEAVGWELFARGALRKGAWKIVHLPAHYGGVGVGDNGWELFNVVDDPGETKDLADVEPEKLRELLAHWDEYVVECGVVWGELATCPGRSKEEAPEYWQDEWDLQKSWMGAKAGECAAP